MLRMVQRVMSTAGSNVTESLLIAKLRAAFPSASGIQVEDISGGCGAMFEVYVSSPEFGGLSRVKQHQLVNTALAEEVKAMHGIRITTSATPFKSTT